MIAFTLPIRTVSESNARGHWAAKHRRTQAQRGVVRMATRAKLSGYAVTKMVTLTRIAPRELDDDNLRGALKAVRDGVADALGVNDRDPRVVWRYAQRKGSKPREYGVQIQIEARDLASGDHARSGIR